MSPRATAPRDARIAARVEAWFRDNARDLPWRRRAPDGRRDPYRSLVSEAMLQQTQVARVIERFDEFLERFPTLESLAEAELDHVLAAWSGLGYYRRARLLHEAARAIVERHDGKIPDDAKALRTLPGVGRYTAGALASMVFGHREPIVDGNVRRVIMRADAVERDETWAWERARALVEASDDPAALNEGLMELGALLCTPRAPRCRACPLSRLCVARREGRQHEIPSPRTPARRRVLHHASILVRDRRGRLLIEQRDERGLWAGMWQAPTLEREDRTPTPREIARAIGVPRADMTDRFTHQTTHRRVEVVVWEGRLEPRHRPLRGRWATRREILSLALSNPQRRILLGETA